MSTTTELVTPLDLNVGDVVRSEGLRVQIETITRLDDPYRSGTGEVIVSAHGRILNPEYVAANRHLFGGIVPPDGAGGWTVQGNRLATVAREVSAEEAN